MSGFEWGAVRAALPILWEGMQVTLLLTVLGIAGGIGLGIVLAAMRRSRLRALRWFAAAYVDVLRALPLVLLIFWFYFLVPLVVGRPVGGFASALTGFILFEAAYFCEIIRAGIGGIRRGQVLAGLATGLTEGECFRLVVLPQAVRAMAPVLLLQCINLFKSTSLVYVIGLRDFLTAADLVGTRDNRLVEMYVLVAAVFFVLCFAASRATALLVRR